MTHSRAPDAGAGPVRPGPVLPRRSVLAALALGAGSARAAGPPPVAQAFLAQRAGRIPQCPARDVRNGWGVCGNAGLDAPVEKYAAMLEQVRTRDLRVVAFQFGQSAAPRFHALRAAMQARGMSQPLPRLAALVTAYMHDIKTTWEMQQAPLLALARTGMLRAIEGPNELNGRTNGIGTHGPDDVTDRATSQDFPANHLAWCQALSRFKRENRSVLGGVTTVAPSLVISPPSEFKRLADVSGLVDVGNVHYYAGGGYQPNLSLRFNPFVGTFQNALHWAKVAQMGGGQVWLTECGASTSNNYARSGVSQAKYLANQLFNYFAAGGQRMYIYQLINGSGKPGDVEGNFGLFQRDGTPKPVVELLAGLQDLLSLGSYDDPRNAADTAPIPQVFDPQALAVPGLTGEGAADPSCLVMPKSDGSTLVALWNEPPIDDGKGREIEPAEHPVTADLGSTRRFVVHDLMAPDLRAGMQARRAAPRTGRVAELVLRGHPVVIELLAPA